MKDDIEAEVFRPISGREIEHNFESGKHGAAWPCVCGISYPEWVGVGPW